METGYQTRGSEGPASGIAVVLRRSIARLEMSIICNERSGFRMLMAGVLLVVASNAHAQGMICMRNDQLPQPDIETKQRIETYLQGLSQVGGFRIGRLFGGNFGNFFVAWPEHDDCKPCRHHLIQLRGTDLIDLLAFEGSGIILTWDSPVAYDPALRNTYTYFYVRQTNNWYLFLGLPKSQGALFVSALSSDETRHLPSCYK